MRQRNSGYRSTGKNEASWPQYSNSERLPLYAARSILYRTARLAESGVDVMNEGAIAKVFVTEAAGRVVDQAIQLAGGQALIQGHPLEALYRQVRSWRLAEGASDLLRLNIVKGLIEFNAFLQILGQFHRVLFGIGSGEFAIRIAGAGDKPAAEMILFPIETHFHNGFF